MKKPIPEAVLSQHIAFIGKTGSGKTSNAKPPDSSRSPPTSAS